MRASTSPDDPTEAIIAAWRAESARGGEEEAMPDLDGQADHIEDDVLPLIFLSCHPSLTPSSGPR